LSRHIVLSFFIGIFLGLGIALVIQGAKAQDSAPDERVLGMLQKGDSHSAAVVPDEESGIVRIIIDGKEVGRFDATGFHVDGDVTFTGAFIDTGETVTGNAPSAP